MGRVRRYWWAIVLVVLILGLMTGRYWDHAARWVACRFTYCDV